MNAKTEKKVTQCDLDEWIENSRTKVKQSSRTSPQRRMLSREEILTALQNLVRDLGRPPSQNDPRVSNLVYAARKEFGSWHHALAVAGLQTYAEWKKKHSLHWRIYSFLKDNPSTWTEIRKEMNCSGARLASCWKLCEDIKSIGPRKKKVYFVSGQEQIAKRKLEEVVSEVDPLTEIVYSLVQRPMTYEQLETSAKSQAEIEGIVFLERKVKNALSILRMAHIVYKVEFSRAGRHGGTKYSCFDLFGDLANKTYYCRYDCPRAMADFVSSRLPQARKEGAMRSLTIHLKRILPRDVLESLMWTYE